VDVTRYCKTNYSYLLGTFPLNSYSVRCSLRTSLCISLKYVCRFGRRIFCTNLIQLLTTLKEGHKKTLSYIKFCYGKSACCFSERNSITSDGKNVLSTFAFKNQFGRSWFSPGLHVEPTYKIAVHSIHFNNRLSVYSVKVSVFWFKLLTFSIVNLKFT